MNPKTITLTHANMGTKMEIAVALVAGWFPSKEANFTYVVASGGASFPASETPDEVSKLYSLAMSANNPPVRIETGITKE